MRLNLIKKVVVGGLITSLCLCCCFLNFNKNVFASDINNDLTNIVYGSDFTSYFNFKNYGHIESLNDLKGTMWVCNYDCSYPTFSDDFNTYTLSYISPLNAIEENNYLLAPFILQSPNYFLSAVQNIYPYSVQCYSLSSSSCIEFVENFANSDGLKNFISSDLTSTTLLNGKYIFDNNSFREQDLIIACNVDLGGNLFATSQVDIYYSHYARLMNDNENDYYSAMSFYGMCSPIFLFFPNSNYTLEYSSSNELIDDNSFLEYFKTQFTLIEVENFSIYKNSILKDLEFQKGYDDGYNQGVYDATDTGYRFPFLTGIFNAVSDILALEIFPNVRLGYFVLIPLALGVTGMIFWFWRKD